MSNVIWKASATNSIEHQFEELERKLSIMNIKFMVLIVLFVLAYCFLCLPEKTTFKILTAGAPFAIIYFILFIKLLKNYRRLLKEYKKLKEKQAIEQGQQEALRIKMNTQFLYFRRN